MARKLNWDRCRWIWRRQYEFESERPTPLHERAAAELEELQKRLAEEGIPTVSASWKSIRAEERKKAKRKKSKLRKLRLKRFDQ
jgi:hypothetical protein